MSENERSHGLKLVVAAALLVGSVVFVYAQWKSTRPAPPPADERPIAEQRFAEQRPSREEMEQRRAEMFSELNLTPEQQEQIQALGTPEGRGMGREAGRARMEAMREILTSEQREQMREQMTQRMRDRMSRQADVLPPDQREAFNRRLEERIEQHQRFFDGGPPGQQGAPNESSVQGAGHD